MELKLVIGLHISPFLNLGIVVMNHLLGTKSLQRKREKEKAKLTPRGASHHRGSIKACFRDLMDTSIKVCHGMKVGVKYNDGSINTHREKDHCNQSMF